MTFLTTQHNGMSDMFSLATAAGADTMNELITELLKQWPMGYSMVTLVLLAFLAHPMTGIFPITRNK